MSSPFDTPSTRFDPSPPEKPGVLLWAKIYLTLTALMYLAMIPLGAFVMFADLPTNDETPEWLMQGQAGLMLVMGVVFGAGYLSPWFLKRSKANWIVHIVLIAWSCMSCCTWPFSIPLLIFWLKPETRAYFEAE